MSEKTGNRIRYKGVYRLYKDGESVSETPYNLLDAFGSTPEIALDELEHMTTQDIEARASAMIEAIKKCDNFKIINNVIEKSDDCSDEEDYMIGQIIDYAGTNGTWDTEKWRECNGDVVAIADFPELYEIIGREWSSDTLAAGYFMIPDLRRRVEIGFSKESSATPRNQLTQSPPKENYGRVGNTGGATGVQLVPKDLPDFVMSLPGQTGGDDDTMSNKTAFAGGDKSPAETGFNFDLPVKYSRNKQTTDYLQLHENRPPYAVVYKLIRYK
jgi:microcystin-dependent protein